MSLSLILVGGTRDAEDRFWKILASFENISNEDADVLDVMNSNRKINISLDGTLLFYTTNLNAFVLPLYEFVESDHWKRENINFRLPFLTIRRLRSLFPSHLSPHGFNRVSATALQMIFSFRKEVFADEGPVSRNSRKLFGPEGKF